MTEFMSESLRLDQEVVDAPGLRALADGCVAVLLPAFLLAIVTIATKFVTGWIAAHLPK